MLHMCGPVRSGLHATHVPSCDGQGIPGILCAAVRSSGGEARRARFLSGAAARGRFPSRLPIMLLASSSRLARLCRTMHDTARVTLRTRPLLRHAQLPD